MLPLADEEFLSHYVSFLKATNVRLTPDTVQFFLQAAANSCPLYRVNAFAELITVQEITAAITPVTRNERTAAAAGAAAVSLLQQSHQLIIASAHAHSLSHKEAQERAAASAGLILTCCHSLLGR